MITTVHELTTADGAKVSGILRVPAEARTVVTIMHPRQDVGHHASVPYLLRSGYAVWTQGSRSPNNDLNLLHEQALLDFAAGHVFLRQNGFEHVVSLGHSGGATLAAFYCEQAALEKRLTATPTGQAVPLSDAEMPLPDGCVFMAPHPGPGALLQRVIDGSVTDESDPRSVDPALDPYAEANGFAGKETRYPAAFVERYRAAQKQRIERIDAIARAGETPILTTYRTDADLRNTDLSLDPNERRYGSLFGPHPERQNHGLPGFGRIATPEAWLSTWSATTTNADFERCAAGVTVPALLLELSGDQASFPADIERFQKALADATTETVAGTHFGGPVTRGAPTGTELAAAVMERWIDQRFCSR